MTLPDASIDAVVRGMVAELAAWEVSNVAEQNINRGFSAQLYLNVINRLRMKGDVEGIYIGMILRGWAAIEVALKELYAASIAISVTARALSADGKRINQAQLDRRKITLYRASKPNGQIGFTSLLRAREAYSMAFAVKSKNIDRAMSNLHLDSLALIRNLFVHNDLVPDPDFLKRGENIPALSRFMMPTCKMVRINGRFTRLLVHRAFTATEKLILAVDKWLQKHP